MKSPTRILALLAFIASALTPALPAVAQAGRSLDKCQATVAKESAKYARALGDVVGKCLQEASTEVVVNGGSAGDAAARCTKLLAKVADSTRPDKTLAGRFDAKVGKACDPAVNPGLAHAEADIYTIGATRISAANLDDFCRAFGGDGSIDDFDEWRDCVRSATECVAYQSVATQYPRALEYLAPINAAIASLPATQATTDALAALQAIETDIEGSTDDDRPELACGPSATTGATGGIPQTGQTVCTNSSGSVILCSGSGQDGEYQRGIALTYTDHGLTITDNSTGLTWEKLCQDVPPYTLCPEDHSNITQYSWDQAFAKVAAMNSAGYGGFSDWRLPHRRELMSLSHYGRSTADPAYDPSFVAGYCLSNCAAVDCNCPRGSELWSSTSVAMDPNDAWFVDDRTGFLGRRSKLQSFGVRAVRGGS